jgi:nucleoside-triphosphatase THEP1
MDIDVRSLPEGITILTGGRGAGKTRTCQQWMDQARLAGWSVVGVLCPAVFNDGIKTDIDMLDAATGLQQRLAHRENRQTGFEVTDHWNFDPVVLEMGNEILVSAGYCDLLIVDELGPLEFHRKQGWVKAFETLARGKFKRAVVVIRPELLKEAYELWPAANIVKLDS